MKILYVVSGFAPAWGLGGGVRASYELSKEMVQKGHEVVVYATDIFDYKARINYSYKNWYGVKSYYFKAVSNILAKKQLNCSLSLIWNLYANIENYDIVHIHEYRTVNGSFAAYFAKRKGIPYIIQPHGSLPTTIGMKKMKKYYDIFVGNNILKNASKLIALNKMEEEQYIDMNIEKNKIEIAPNGIDLAQYTYLPKKNSFKKKYGINLNERIILYLGRINKIKGIDLLIEAFEELSKEMNDIRLVIVGPDNGFVSTLKNRMETLNIQHKVLFTGPLYEKNKLEAYVDADVLVYPSSFEIFGLVPLESLMCGTPVIVTDNCGCAEIIKKSESGYLVKYGDVEDLKQKMQILIKCNSKENLAAKGKKYIENNLALDVIAHTMEMIYRKCDDNC